jgi:hypothetical protein
VLYDKRVGLHYKRFWLISQTARLANQRPASQKFFRLGSNPRSRAKSIVKIRFVEQQPISAWTRAGPREYGFYSNVNPNVDHPRWSQVKERRIGEFFKRDTLMFNGYGDQVARLYAGMDLKRNF